MKNQELYDAALRACCEYGGQGMNTDYEDRSCYLLPIVCARLAHLDVLYRAANGLSDQLLPETLCYTMTADFPLSAALAPCAATLLAALLTLEEAPTVSHDLQQAADTQLRSIRDALPATPEPIVDRYRHLK